MWLHDARTGKERAALEKPEKSCGALALSPDGKLLATVEGFDPRRPDGPVRLLDLASGKLAGTLPVSARHFHRARFSPDGRLLAATDSSGGVQLWDVRDRRLRARLTAGDGKKLWLAGGGFGFSPDGELLAAAGSGEGVARVFEVATGEEVLSFAGHDGPVFQLLFSGRGDLLLTRSEDQTVLAWDVTWPPAAAGGAVDVKGCWKAMGEPTAEGFRAGLRLLARPDEAVKLFGQELKAVVVPDSKRIAALVRRLDADTQAERQGAYRELARLGRAAERELRAALKAPPSPEAARSARRLLEALARGAPTGDSLRALRAVRVLEQIGTAGARRVLITLSKGAAEAELTRATRAALRRFSERRE